MVSLKLTLALLTAASSVLAGGGGGRSYNVAGDTSIIAHEGETIGKEIQVENVTMYISEPPCKKSSKKDVAVLYLTDVFGIQLAQNKLLADSFARAGYLTLTPDLFSGSPAPTDLTQPGWDIQAFLAANSPSVIDPIIATAISHIRKTLGPDAKIMVTGYCFGGRFAFRAAAADADVVFAAHPSNLGDEEILAVAGPASIAAAETDGMLDAVRRAEIEGLLREADVPYQLTLYGGTSHGFGVRADVSDPEQLFAKESAFLQAVRWFEAWA